MDSTVIRVVCAGLALLLGGVIFMRRKGRGTE
jgi:hypothetical protein